MHPRDASVAVIEVGDFGLPTFVVGGEPYFGKDHRRAVACSVLDHLATRLEFPHPRTGTCTVVGCPPPRGLRR